MSYLKIPGEDFTKFSVSSEQDGNQAVFRVRGDVDMATADQVWLAAVSQIETDQPTTVVIDLAEVRFLNSAGLLALERAQTDLHANGSEMIVRNPSPVAQRVLEISGMSDIFIQDIPDQLAA